MSNSHSICFVCRITTNGVTYYYCSSQRVAALTLTDDTYQPYILSIGDTEKLGNFGEGNQIGKCSVQLLFGQLQYQDPYNIDISVPWNNGTCEIRICDVDSHSSWTDCDLYYAGVIKGFTINYDNIQFQIEDANQKDNINLPLNTVEDIVNDITYLSLDDIPKRSVGKYIPIQYGYLNDKDNGMFAKGISISSKIGFQEIHYDTQTLSQLTLSSTSGIGVWEDGLKRFFVGKSDNEYEAEATNNIVKFRVDTTTTLNSGFSMSATSGQEQIQITNGSLITFDRESEDNYYTETAELLGSNIIAIDNELMMLLDVPDTDSSPNTVWIERGYGNTEPEVHSELSPVYQSAKYSARNLLSFTELFLAKVVANPHYSVLLEIGAVLDQEPDEYIISPIGNIVVDDLSNYFQYFQRMAAESTTQYNFDVRFNKIDGDYTLTGMYAGMYALYKIYSQGHQTAIDHTDFVLSIFDPYQDISYNEETDLRTSIGNAAYTFQAYHYYTIPDESILIDTISSIQRNVTIGDNYINVPSLLRDDYGYGLSLTNLKDLNRKWKVNLYCDLSQYSESYTLASEISLKIYKFGLWCDFFIDFTARPIMATLVGREVTTEIDAVLGTSKLGDPIYTPLQVLLDILIREMGYTVNDMDLDSWQSVNEYNDLTREIWQVMMSYGIDESKKGWELCQEIASFYGMMLTKMDDGKIKIVSLFQLSSVAGYGYSSLSSYKISIDDVVFSGGKKSITIQQTGTDRIRNVVRVNYRRNNSTGEYQAVYPQVQSDLDSYVLSESGLTLAQARTKYYGGQKTETLVIDAYTIYREYDARVLAEWHLNDKAEAHFYVTVSLPYYHYSDKNSKSLQYDVGDLMYLDGIYQGITFNSSHLFVIQETTKTNQGREITIGAKSIEPVSEF